MIFAIDRENGIPIYLQIAAQIRRMIADGALKAGDRLPPNRELAQALNVNRATVSTAYAELEADGLIESHVGRGTFITARPAAAHPSKENVRPTSMAWNALFADQQRDTRLTDLLQTAQRKDTISLAHGLPSADLFPLEEIRRCVDRALRKEGRALLQLGLAGGYPPLQEYLASQMAISGIAVNPDEVLITNGCQQSLDLIRRVLVGPGDEVAIENPTYPGAISIFCGGDSRYLSVPVGDNGIALDALEDILSRSRPKLLYVISSYHNPTGATMDMKARRRLLELAAAHRVPVVEDDIYRELHYDGPQYPSLKALDQYGIVISINSFSKIGFPGLRVGWITAPRPVIERLNVAKQICDFHASMLSQAAIYEFSRHGLLAKHIKRVKKAYAERRDAMMGALERYFPEEATWQKPQGGMAVWIKLPEVVNTNEILLYAAEQGVVFAPGEHFYSSLPERNRMRLCFTVAAPAEIEAAVKRLGVVIEGRLLSIKKQRSFRAAEAARALV